jgi:hypothetical protein
MIVKGKKMTNKLSRSLFNIKNDKKKREKDRQINWTRIYRDCYKSSTLRQYNDGVSILVLIHWHTKNPTPLLFFFFSIRVFACMLVSFRLLALSLLSFSVHLHALSHSLPFVRSFARSLCRKDIAINISRVAAPRSCARNQKSR